MYTVARFDPRLGTYESLPDQGPGRIRLTAPDTQDWAFVVRVNGASTGPGSD